MDTFVPPRPPDYDSNGISDSPRVVSASFGDGYKQQAPDGLNADEATATYQWSLVTQDERDAMTTFYKAHIGLTFKWDMPDMSGVQKWRITKYSTSVASYDRHNVTMSLERSFEL